jgi:hypothetical protein
MGLKTCRICGLSSDNLELFQKHPTGKHGRGSLCKACNNQQKRDVRKSRSNLINDYKAGKPCSRCGQVFPPICMDFHHVGDNKTSDISYMTFHDVIPLNVVFKEMDKCILLCACCHRLVHQEELNGDQTKED